jgi:lactoylglutathione lyase
LRRAEGDDVAIVRNGNGVELNLIFNANAGEPGPNVLMDVPEKYPGYTHMALRVGSIPATIAALNANDIAITQGPVSFGETGQVSVFVRDPDRNVIELRPRSGCRRGCHPLRAIDCGVLIWNANEGPLRGMKTRSGGWA